MAVFAETVRAFPERPALEDGEGALTYTQLAEAVRDLAARLTGAGVGRGDRVGVRMPSGSRELYITILAVLRAGAAYVPVDADDPDERAAFIFREAAVGIVVTPDLVLAPAAAPPQQPTVADDAWVIFTSGSTGTPKGVAVSHRSAAAFIDAEARLFLTDAPIGPGDRVLAGLSVGFDASCEEMWLAWRHGACLVPAPRSLVRAGVDLGPWLVEQRVTIVSTVPTLAALWPSDTLDGVRLLIFGGEACPPDLAERLVDDGREVWNTYGPTEATVVACAARLADDEPVRIGLPLDGWELAVVDKDGRPVESGETGELIIGGVGLARYLDAAKDAEKFAPMPALGWERAYRSGDLVRFDGTGLLFGGRADEQVKIGGRRIELGEVDVALQGLAGVAGAAAAVRTTRGGNQILVGYVVVSPGVEFDTSRASSALRELLPAGLVPMLVTVQTLPTRTSGKVDRDALPWPVAAAPGPTPEHGLSGVHAWIAELWATILGASVSGVDDDFFAHGGGSLAAAQLVSSLRTRFPQVTVADVYAHPRLADLADFLDRAKPVEALVERIVRPTPLGAQAAQLGVMVVVNTIAGLRWLTLLGASNNLLQHWAGPLPWAPTISWWWLLGGFLLLISPMGRMAVAVAGARLLLRGVRAGDYPRGGGVHLRLWAAEQLAEAVGAANLAGAPWISYYARALGAKIGRGVDLHALPPITGLMTLGRECAIEPEVDLSGYWVDGDRLRLGEIVVGPRATVGSRSTLGPDVVIGRDAQIVAGSWVRGDVANGEQWAGSPAERVGVAVPAWPPMRPAQGRRWLVLYGVASAFFSVLPALAGVPSLLLVGWAVRRQQHLAGAAAVVAQWLVVAALGWLVVYALATLFLVRMLGLGVREGHHPVRSRIGWQVWAAERVLDSARTLLFPLYSSLFTPTWLRWLGAEVGRGVEASTVLLLPKMTSIADGAFLADDTMIASYELGGGWLRIAPAKVGKRAFLGNSAMAAPGRSLAKKGLVAVLSSTPERSKKASSWLGSPPVQLRRSAAKADLERTFAPPARLKVARGLIELCRLTALIATFGVGFAVLLCLEALIVHGDYVVAGVCGGAALLVAGGVSASATTAVKWVLVGPLRVGEHPLWSAFVWRNEVVDTFVEMLAAPWFARAAAGTPVLNMWLRSMGARIGRGVWCETYWLPEADLVRLGDACTVNRGCVLQTHLFHDRIMQIDSVELGVGATLGPHGVILPAAAIGRGATVGPASLVMRGEAVPPETRWVGNPISPWVAP